MSIISGLTDILVITERHLMIAAACGFACRKQLLPDPVLPKIDASVELGRLAGVMRMPTGFGL